MEEIEKLKSLARMADERGDKETALKAMRRIKELQSVVVDPAYSEGEIPQVDESGQPIVTYEPQAQEERTAGDVFAGLGETARSTIQGALLGAPAYLSGAVEGLYRRFTEEGFEPEDAAKLAYNRAASVVTPQETQTGQDIAEFIGDISGSLPPVLGVAPAAIPSLAQGAQAARGASAIAGAKTAQAVQKIPQRSPFTTKGKAKQRIAQLIDEGSSNIDTALVEKGAKPTTITGQFKEKLLPSFDIVDDAAAISAKNQGFDEGVIAAIKVADPQTKKSMQNMLNIKQKASGDRLFEVKNRPTDVVGDNLMKRVRAIQGANKAAGKDLDRVAKDLRGKPADFDTPINQFLDDLDDIGVSLDENLKPRFDGSDIEGVKGAENAIDNIVNRLSKGGKPDAYDLHRAKKFIDEQVTYGKNAEGLAGKTEIILKDLRRNIDSVLDDAYPEYNQVNTAYSETIGALDALQDVAGRKMRVNLVDAIDEIEGVANKYYNYTAGIDETRLPDLSATSKKPFTDDLLMQVLFADELDAQFKPSARTSFENLATRQIKRGADALTPSGRQNIILEKGGEVLEKAKGINEENAFKAMREKIEK